MNNTQEDLKQEIWQNFVEQQNIFLATADGNQPRLRPVTLIRLKNRLFVATGAGDAKVKQIRQNPKTEFCLLVEKEGRKGTIRAECEAELVHDSTLKADAYNKIPFMKEFWSSPEDSGYALIELRPTSYEY
ncbi:MAG: pyridoxamine 5'-phosphate oxidase family protein, partial [Candidatus Bathyarchaeota archaeon]|nr:pyridoxamine 5'-phosphate oxidase family protein [Candidatus Bathyarchaeota archaeon]